MTTVLALKITLSSFHVAHKTAFWLVVALGSLQTLMAVYGGWISVGGIHGNKTRHYVGFGAVGLLLLAITVAIAYFNDRSQVASDRTAEDAKRASETLHDDLVRLYDRTSPSNVGATPQARETTLRDVHDQIRQALVLPKPTPVISETGPGNLAPAVPSAPVQTSPRGRDLSGETDLGVIHALEGTLKRMNAASSDFHQRCQILTASISGSGDDSTTPIPFDIQVPITDAYRTRTRSYDEMIKPDISTAIAEALLRLNVPQPVIVGKQVELGNLSRDAETYPTSFAFKSVCKAGDFTRVQLFTEDIMKQLRAAAK